jgi:hypothetical protein
MLHWPFGMAREQWYLINNNVFQGKEAVYLGM